MLRYQLPPLLYWALVDRPARDASSLQDSHKRESLVVARSDAVSPVPLVHWQVLTLVEFLLVL